MANRIYTTLQAYEIIHDNGDKRLAHARSDRTAVRIAGEWAQRTRNPVADVVHVPADGNRRAVVNA